MQVLPACEEHGARGGETHGGSIRCDLVLRLFFQGQSEDDSPPPSWQSIRVHRRGPLSGQLKDSQARGSAQPSVTSLTGTGHAGVASTLAGQLAGCPTLTRGNRSLL